MRTCQRINIGTTTLHSGIHLSPLKLLISAYSTTLIGLRYVMMLVYPYNYFLSITPWGFVDSAKGNEVPRVNRLKTLIQEKQAEHKKRTGKSLPRHVIAYELDIDPGTLSEYVNNKTASINWSVWQRMVDYFGVSGDDIFNVTASDEE
jgi:hypothetical protein